MRDSRTPVTLQVMGQTADPTMELIRSLDDPSRFVQVDRVAVFKPHRREFPEVRLPDGKVIPARTVMVTESDLDEIARNVNRAYQQDGELVKLTIGHRKQAPAADERTQPIEVGYARNYRAEWVERPGGRVLRLTHTEYHRLEYADECRKRSGRSPEYDPDGKTITAVSLLTRDPALQLGTVSYDAGRRLAVYQMGDAMADETKTDDADDVKFYAAFKRCMAKYMAETGDPKEPAPVPYQKPTPAPAPVVDPAVTALQAQVAALTRQRTEESAKRLLDPLTQLVSFDYQRELTALVNYADDASRAAHVQYMLARYEKLPTGTVPFPIATQGANPSGKTYDPTDPMAEPPHLKDVRLYMRANPGVQYDEAEAHVLSQKK